MTGFGELVCLLYIIQSSFLEIVARLSRLLFSLLLMKITIVAFRLDTVFRRIVEREQQIDFSFRRLARTVIAQAVSGREIKANLSSNFNFVLAPTWVLDLSRLGESE
jgi:hypothetical protein